MALLPPDIAVSVSDATRVGEARRAAVAHASALGFDETISGRVAIVATELATNLARHAQGGELLVSAVGEALHLVAVDRGPGITRLAEALRDGHSTSGTSGNGLGSVQRLATTFEVHTVVPLGTTVFARFERQPSPARALELGAVCLPVAGEHVSGDAWAIHQQPGRATILVVDGLGHGIHAADAANVGRAIFLREAAAGHGPARIIEAMHAGMRSTRGAAVGIAALDLRRRVVRFAGVGNIAGTMIINGTTTKSFVSHGGIVGGPPARPQELEYPWAAGTLLVLASDGLQTQWKLDRYPGIAMRHPALVAATLYRDWARGRDDLTVFALRES